MKSVFVTLASTALFVAGALGQALQINTPTSVVECEPVLFTWTGGTPPYFLSIVPGGQSGAAALQSFPQTSSTQLTWTANITAGTSIGLNLRDSTGTVAQSAPFNVQSGSSSCAGGSSGGSSPTTTGGSSPTTTGGSTTGGATTTAPGASSTGGSTGTTSRAASTGGSSSTGSAAGGSSSATSSSNSAPTQLAQFGAAGLLGAAVMAVLA